MFKKPPNLKGLTANLVQGLLNNVPTFRFFCFFVERNLMHSSYILLNKFQWSLNEILAQLICEERNAWFAPGGAVSMIKHLPRSESVSGQRFQFVDA